ncbi:MAG: hypothetical protein PHG97_05380 [Candidatus Margulisbacteria bacterium]|nr:hypothetical protein [Candidatus Margulisiibacteriota bacterium]
MKEVSEERKSEILKALEIRKADLPCPRCGNKSFVLLGETDSPLNGAVMSCKLCGFLSVHNLESLGIK